MKINPHVGRFASMASRVAGELSGRVEDGEHSLRLHNAYLDDVMFGVRPNDFILVGAPTGAGKTDLIMNIATTNAHLGKRVHVFALEAEPRELERRTKYAMLSQLAHSSRHPDASQLNYAPWRMGKCEEICGQFNAQVDKVIAKRLATLYTFYRDQVFSFDDLRRFVLDIADKTDLIIIDHLHYIDIEEDENEARAQGNLVKSIRQIALNVGKPVVLVAHLRKRNPLSKAIVTNIGEFHGSSNITKIVTHTITIDRCHAVEPKAWFESPTFFCVAKDRLVGEQPYAAVMTYDRRQKSYSPHYTLGRLTKGNTEWEPIDPSDRPPWAIHHKPLEVQS